MKPIFHPRLVNPPLGDPGLLVQFLYERRALLFDLGDISVLENATLLKVSHVFVSHTHIDHFIGFDRLLRVVFGQGKTLTLYGPAGIIANVEGKLAGFTWNLVDRYSQAITINVVEVHPGHLLRARFRAVDKFKRSEEGREDGHGGVLLEEPGFKVRAAILEHRVPCLGFTLNETFHINIDKDALDARGLPPGPWLNALKQCIYEEKPDDHPVVVPAGAHGPRGPLPLAELKRELVLISPGQKIAYVVDTVFKDGNRERIVELVRGADLFFCESPFIAEEEERARDRCHLTSRQAGTLAREAGVHELCLFHFSPRHTFRQEQLVREAEEAFLGHAGAPAGAKVRKLRD